MEFEVSDIVKAMLDCFIMSDFKRDLMLNWILEIIEREESYNNRPMEAKYLLVTVSDCIRFLLDRDTLEDSATWETVCTLSCNCPCMENFVFTGLQIRRMHD